MSEVKLYTLDTDVFRHMASRNSAQQYKRANRRFWWLILSEVKDYRANLLTPKQVRYELEVQFYNLPNRETEMIRRLLKNTVTSVDKCNREIEHTIRLMESFVKAHYSEDISTELPQYKIEYGGINDANILYSAWREDSILVTANIKDFLFYVFLFEYDEDRLYDLLRGEFVHISNTLIHKILNDEEFKHLYSNFKYLAKD
ncbi:DUF4411 domain-containing protein [Sporolactobacillus sp. Y61]|uniref:DUF4411 domain-containing protein n=1 Tax=Sporolactobacillus sp. Y61 TaxID=3160863 RepID=A0AAU8IJ88_9BACL